VAVPVIALAVVVPSANVMQILAQFSLVVFGTKHPHVATNTTVPSDELSAVNAGRAARANAAVAYPVHELAEGITQVAVALRSTRYAMYLF